MDWTYCLWSQEIGEVEGMTEASDCNRWIRSENLSVFIGHDCVSLIVRLNAGTWEWTGQDEGGWKSWVDCGNRDIAEETAIRWYRGEDNEVSS